MYTYVCAFMCMCVYACVCVFVYYLFFYIFFCCFLCVCVHHIILATVAIHYFTFHSEFVLKKTSLSLCILGPICGTYDKKHTRITTARQWWQLSCGTVHIPSFMRSHVHGCQMTKSKCTKYIATQSTSPALTILRRMANVTTHNTVRF